MISPLQRPLPTQDITTEKHKTNVHAPSEIQTDDPSNEVTKTYALDRTATGTSNRFYTTCKH
jgi:hypothetical protein